MTSTKRTAGGVVHAPCTARDDWPARSDAERRIGSLPHGRICKHSVRATEIFGFDSILRPTWIYVARTEGGMSMSARYFPQRWARLKSQRTAERRVAR